MIISMIKILDMSNETNPTVICDHLISKITSTICIQILLYHQVFLFL